MNKMLTEAETPAETMTTQGRLWLNEFSCVPFKEIKKCLQNLHCKKQTPEVVDTFEENYSLRECWDFLMKLWSLSFLSWKLVLSKLFLYGGSLLKRDPGGLTTFWKQKHSTLKCIIWKSTFYIKSHHVKIEKVASSLVFERKSLVNSLHL